MVNVPLASSQAAIFATCGGLDYRKSKGLERLRPKLVVGRYNYPEGCVDIPRDVGGGSGLMKKTEALVVEEEDVLGIEMCCCQDCCVFR